MKGKIRVYCRIRPLTEKERSEKQMCVVARTDEFTVELPTHIYDRHHVLTMLMSDSLGGNAKTLMFVNVSPVETNLDETHNSLLFASRLRSIKNDPSKNVSSKEVARLKKLVTYWKEQAGGKGDDEELAEIQDKRPLKKKRDG